MNELKGIPEELASSGPVGIMGRLCLNVPY